MFQLLHLGDELVVGGQEGQALVPVLRRLAAHQGLADEQLARGVRVDLLVAHASAAVDHQAIERGALEGHHLGGLFLPVRVEHLFLQQVRAHLFQPLRLDGGDAPAEQARGLHQFGADDPAARLLAQVRARVAVELDAARAQVRIVFLGFKANVAQQAGQHGQMKRLVAGRLGVERPVVLRHHGEQLAVHVAPLAHAAHVDEVLAQELLVLAVAELVRGGYRWGRRSGGRHGRGSLALRHRQHRLRGATRARLGLLLACRGQGGGTAARLLQPLPELEVAAEFALVVIELGVLLVGLLLGVHGAVAHILQAQGAGDDQHLAEGAARARFEDHAAHARVQRQLGQFAPHGRELVLVVHRAQFIEQLVAVGNRPARGRVDERKVLHHTQVQRLHAQDHARQRGTQDFRVGEARSAREVFLVVEPDADAIGHAAAAPGALVGRRLADGLDQQLLHLATQTVALDARRACVNDVSDARNGKRGLGHVGGQHDAPPGVAVEDAVLLGLAQAREQRQHLGVARHGLVRQVLAQVVGGLADFALAGQKHQDVAARVALPQFVHAVGDGLVQAVVAAFLERPPALLHREGAARHLDDRRRALAAFKVLGKAVRIDGGRGHHHLQVRPARQNLPDVAQQKVDVQAALVRLVDDDRVVGLEQRVGLRLGQQNAVGHELDRGVARKPVLEAHLVTHHLAQRRL